MKQRSVLKRFDSRAMETGIVWPRRDRADAFQAKTDARTMRTRRTGIGGIIACRQLGYADMLTRRLRRAPVTPPLGDCPQCLIAGPIAESSETDPRSLLVVRGNRSTTQVE